MDDWKQQIYELKRSLDIEKANKEYITSELESLQATHDQEKSELLRKHSLEVEKLRNVAKQQLEEQNYSLRQEIDALILRLASVPKELPAPPPPPVDNSETLQLQEQLEEFVEKVRSAQEEVSRLTSTNGHLESRLRDATEKIECLEETLQSKKEEAAERELNLEQYQDTIQELRTELMQLHSEPDPDMDKKGNSLFAEVVDQRQQVVQILGAQSRSFKEMKRAYNQSESEIRQLKEENALMVQELDKIKAIFLAGSHSDSAQMGKRVSDLQRDLERSEQELSFLVHQITEPKIESILEFYRNECDVLRQGMNRARLEKYQLDEMLSNAQKKLAHWRFLCLRQKCILIDREIKLEANNIPFEPRCAIVVDESVPIPALSGEWVTVQDYKDDANVGEKSESGEMEISLGGEVEQEEEEATVVPEIQVKVEPESPPELRQQEIFKGRTEVVSEGDNADVELVVRVDDSIIDLCTTIDRKSPLTSPVPNLPSVPRVNIPNSPSCVLHVEEDKENETRKRNTVTKLNYKPIQSGKSILVKRPGLADQNNRNVHFAVDVKEASLPGVGSVSQPPEGAKERPKKKWTVNVRTIHSRPPK